MPGTSQGMRSLEQGAQFSWAATARQERRTWREETHALGMRLGGKFTGSYPFCSNFQHQIRELALPVLLILGNKAGVRGGIVKAGVAAIGIRKASHISVSAQSQAGRCLRAWDSGRRPGHRVS